MKPKKKQPLPKMSTVQAQETSAEREKRWSCERCGRRKAMEHSYWFALGRLYERGVIAEISTEQYASVMTDNYCWASVAEDGPYGPDFSWACDDCQKHTPQHTWESNTCSVCGLRRKQVKPRSNNLLYVYGRKGEDWYGGEPACLRVP